MKRARPVRAVRVTSQAERSLVRIRTKRRSKSRKRPSPQKLPAKLKEIRDRLGLSQGEIAAKLGVDNRASISGYERGEREPPLPIIVKYAELIGLSTDYIVNDKLDLP